MLIHTVVMNVVVYLPKNFYASVGSFVCEFFLALNALQGRPRFNIKLVSRSKKAITRSGIEFPLSKVANQKIDLLIFLAGHSLNLVNFEAELEEEIDFASHMIARALKDKAVIAGTCSASLLMAKTGLLDRKRATVSWWAATEARRLFPHVNWDSTRIVSRHKKIYTSGGVYSAMDLLVSVLVDMGYENDVRRVRKLLVSPPIRQLQSPYEMKSSLKTQTEFERLMVQLVEKIGVETINPGTIAKSLSMTEKTVTRRFRSELDTTPGKWIQTFRISKAKELLESSSLSIAEICRRVGYDDHPSFVRLFSRITGLTPSEYRRQMQL